MTAHFLKNEEVSLLKCVIHSEREDDRIAGKLTMIASEQSDAAYVGCI